MRFDVEIRVGESMAIIRLMMTVVSDGLTCQIYHLLLEVACIDGKIR